jgi:hypothetical protein
VQRITRPPELGDHPCRMHEVRIALVIRDPATRGAAAEVFDDAPAHWMVRFFDEAPAEAHVVVTEDDRGDLRFDPSKANDLLEEINRVLALRSKARSIAVIGTGCGTTTVALHLSIALGKRASTVLVESNPSRRGLAYRLGMDIAARTWNEACGVALPVAGGLKVCLAPASGEPSAKMIETLGADAEYIIVEPAHVPGWEADVGVFVVGTTYTHVRRAAEILPSLPDIPWAIVANEAAPRSSIGRRAISEILGVEPTIELPFSSRLIDAERKTRPLLSALGIWQHRIARLAGSVVEA